MAFLQDQGNISLRLLGSLAVERDGVEMKLPQSRKTRALLGYLAVTGKPQRRERLCKLFWDLPDDPRAALRWSLSRLRPLVDNDIHKRIIADRDSVALDLSGVNTDISVIRALARNPEKGSLEALQRAGDAAGGIFMEALDLPDAFEYQAWLIAEREAARLAAKRVLETLIIRSAGDPEDAVGYARKLVALAPEDEEAHATLVRTLVLSGRHQEAASLSAIAEQQLAANGASQTGALRRALEPKVSHSDARTDVARRKPSIAVLRFRNAGPQGDEYFAEGMADAITDALSRYGWLFVIARQSSFAFESDADPREIAATLGVRYVVAGSVSRIKERVRITCRLIDGDTGEQAWVESFDSEAMDIFEMQDSVGAAIAGRIEPKITEADAIHARTKPTEALEAYDYYLRALKFIYSPSGHDEAEAIALLEQALLRDSKFAPALVTLAYLRLQGDPYQTKEKIAETVRLAREAARFGEEDARVLALAGFIVGYGAHEYDIADSLMDRALAISNNSFVAWLSKAWANSYWGDVRETEPCLDVAERLSPRDPFRYVLETARASALFQMGDVEGAELCARSAGATNPAFETAIRLHVASLVELGRMDEARQALVRLQTASPNETVGFLRQTLAFRPKSRADRLLEALKKAGLP